MGLKNKAATLRATYGGLRAIGRDPSSLRFERIDSPTRARLEGRDVILFGTNNYLGLTFDSACIKASVDATREQGAGTTGSRVANGTYNGHDALETELAAFYGKRGCIVFSTGYLANTGMISCVAEAGDHLLIDSDSHASIYDGCRLSDAETIRFHHNNPESLARRLARLKDRPGDKIIIVEGIYSMLGDSGKLREIAAVKREAGDNVYLMVDEAHSLGVLGANGRGKAEADGVLDDCDYVVGTFSKSVGTVGGFCVSDIPELDLVRSFSRPYMFTASMTPGTAAAARAGVARISETRELRMKLWRNSRRLYAGLGAMGYKLGPEPSPVSAVVLDDAENAVRLWNALIDEGIYTNIAIPPATPNGLALLRVSVSAAHSEAQITKALNVFAQTGKLLGILPADPAQAWSEKSRLSAGGAAGSGGA